MIASASKIAVPLGTSSLRLWCFSIISISAPPKDFAAIFATGLGGVTASMFFGYILAAATAFGGAYLGIRTMRALAVNIGYGLFVFYSFGAALLSFVLYLMV